MPAAISQSSPALWDLVLHQQHLDPDDLQQSIEQEISRPPMDFRTRLLIRDSVKALRTSQGVVRVDNWLEEARSGPEIRGVEQSLLGPVGFPSLAKRIIQSTKPDTVEQLLRELGTSIQAATRLVIGGSIALIMAYVLHRRAEDIDLVDKVPAGIRTHRELLTKLAKRYGLNLICFKSHYLPRGWESRLHSIGPFGKLHVFLIDPYDIFLGKLFSNREKDRDDLRALTSQFDDAKLIDRLRKTTEAFQRDPALRAAAEKNWYILFGEPLP